MIVYDFIFRRMKGEYNFQDIRKIDNWCHKNFTAWDRSSFKWVKVQNSGELLVICQFKFETEEDLILFRIAWE